MVEKILKRTKELNQLPNLKMKMIDELRRNEEVCAQNILSNVKQEIQNLDTE